MRRAGASPCGSWQILNPLALYVLSTARTRLSDNRGMTQAITRDPEVMHGIPVFRGTRVPVKTLFDCLENGDSLDDFLTGFPTVSRELAVLVREESKELRLAKV